LLLPSRDRRKRPNRVSLEVRRGWGAAAHTGATNWGARTNRRPLMSGLGERQPDRGKKRPGTATMNEPLAPGPVVLVVEDEPLVRMVAVDILEEAGFQVLEASTADYAITVLDKREDITVVFTDVDMPGRLNGFQLARLIEDHHHRVRVIIGSGKCRPGPDDVAPGTMFLQKPYALDRLVREVRRLAAA
jgi:CheY-like chemotaxis protein